MEFSIAMLASGGWSNKEIGEHLGISINTVKHYLTDIFCKLNVKKRDELKKFMLKKCLTKQLLVLYNKYHE